MVEATPPPPQPIPVILLTGFLGSGKTTLLNHLLRDTALSDTAVVVNEIGEIALDHLLVASAQDKVVLLESGCLCCEVADSLGETLADLYGRRARGEIPPFARVIIETTGLADPAPIVRILMRDALIRHSFRLSKLICTIDALFGMAQLDRAAEAVAQAASADILILTKSDIATGPTEPLRARLHRLNPVARILRTPVDAAILEGTTESFRPPAHHVHHDPAVTSLSFARSSAATLAGIGAWTAALRLRFGSDLLRCKALIEVAGQDRPIVLHGVQTVFDTVTLPAWPDGQRGVRIMCVVRDGAADWIAQSLRLLTLPEGSQPPTALHDLDFQGTAS